MIDDEIRLSLPAVAEYARLARLAVGGLAIRVGFDYDEVEDLRIAVGEAFSLIIACCTGPGTVLLVFRLRSNGMEIDVTAHGDGEPGDSRLPTPLVKDGLSAQILDALVDRYDLGPEGVHLHKRRYNLGP